MNPYLGVVLIAVGFVALIYIALAIEDARHKLDQLILTDLTDDEPRDDLRFRRHTDSVLALFDDPAEEAQR